MNKLHAQLRTYFILLLFIFPFIMHAQVIDVNGKNNSVNYERLAKIDGLINDYIKKDWVKGVVTIVVKDNQVVQYKGYGYADAETKEAMQKDELFRIASQTKALTATNTLMNTTGYTPNEGDVTFRNNTLLVYRDTTWVPTTDNQTVGNGLVVHTNGQVTNGNDTDTLTDGEVVSKQGTFFDQSGRAVKDAFNGAKHGVGEAGEAVGHAAGEAGEAVGKAAGDAGQAVGNAAKDAVNGDKH